MAKDELLEARYKHIVNALASSLVFVEELIEDPIFISNIHGEQEIALDQFADLLADLIDQFDGQGDEAPVETVRDSELYDVT